MQKIKKMKVMTVLGTRPEVVRLSRVLPKLDEFFEHVIVFTRQSYDYELSEIFFQELLLRKPNYILDVKAETLGGQIANIIRQTEETFLKEKPDSLLILGDTNSSLCAIVAKRLKIPVFHMEAGNRSFDWNVPEEVNRRIVDHISDYNLCYTKNARDYLKKEGIAPQTIFVTGSPLAEVFLHFKEKIENSSILKDLNLTPKRYFLVSTHREENVDNKNNLAELFSSFASLATTYNLPVIVSLHPRTKKKLEEAKIKIYKGIILTKPFGYLEYCKLQKNALCVVSDSGTIQEESAILNFPAIQIRVSTERPEAFDTGSIILTGFNQETILNAINLAITQEKKGEKQIVASDYKDINVSTKVAKLIMGLTGIKKYHDRKL